MAKTKKAAPPADETTEEEVELEELDEETTEADTAKAKKSKTPDITFGVADLAKHLSEKTGKEVTTRELRTQIRRMAREDKPRVDREIVPGNRTRYDWPLGLKDPEVKAIIKAVMGGEIEEGKKEALAKLKESKAAKAAAKGEKKGKGKGKAKKAAPADDEVEEIDLDEDDD